MKEPFETVVLRHGSTVLRVCRAVVGPDDADDAWQETFIAALRAYPDLPHDANVEAWLVTIAHRKALDIVRADERRAVPVAEVPETGALGGSPGGRARAGAGAGPPGGYPGQEAYEVWELVRRLPPRQRQVLAYRYLAGLPYATIARILGGTAEAARRAAADGLKSLRRAVAEPHPPLVEGASR